MTASLGLAFGLLFAGLLSPLLFGDRAENFWLMAAVWLPIAAMAQPQISNIEGGDSVPPLPLLTRLAEALESSLTIQLGNSESTFVFTPHKSPGPGDSSRDSRTSAA